MAMCFVGSTFETTQISGKNTFLSSAAGLFYCPLRNLKQFIRSQRLQGSLKVLQKFGICRLQVNQSIELLREFACLQSKRMYWSRL